MNLKLLSWILLGWSGHNNPSLLNSFEKNT